MEMVPSGHCNRYMFGYFLSLINFIMLFDFSFQKVYSTRLILTIALRYVKMIEQIIYCYTCRSETQPLYGRCRNCGAKF